VIKLPPSLVFPLLKVKALTFNKHNRY